MIYKDMFKYIKLPDIISIVGLVFSVLSIISSIEKKFELATIFITVSMLFDYSDGKVSRALKREGRFGRELDNLCDVVLYLISIIIFGYMIGLNSTLAVSVYIIFMIAGILRLARFGILGLNKGTYEGLPVGYAIIIPYIYFIFILYSINLNYLLLLYFIPSFLMISSIKVKKF